MTTNGGSTGAPYRDVSFEELGGLPANARIIDVREPDEFVGELGHLPEAELHPLGGLLGAAEAWSREAPLLLVCRSGGRSSRAAVALAQLGFSQLYNLRGGMLAVAERSTSPRS